MEYSRMPLFTLSNAMSQHTFRHAAGVHNLPVMNQALALGADRDWVNFHTASTSPVIHQSIRR